MLHSERMKQPELKKEIGLELLNGVYFTDKKSGKKIYLNNLGEVVRSLRPLIILVAKKYFYRTGRAFDKEDLLQEGRIAILEAINKFDPKKSSGEFFPDFATFFIQNRLKILFSKLSSPVSIPPSSIGIVRSACNRGLISRNRTDYRIDLKSDEVKKLLKDSVLSERHIEGFNLLNSQLNSEDNERILGNLSQYCGRNKDLEGDFIRLLDNKHCIEIIMSILDDLKPKWKTVIIHRYGLNGHEPKTLEEIGKILGVTRERVRQIHKKSLEIIRKKLKRLHISF